MNQQEILSIIKLHLAKRLNCSVKDFEKEGTVFICNDKQKNPFFEITTFGKSVVVSASPDKLPGIQLLLTGKSRDEIFECPFVYGQTIYYIPDLKLFHKSSWNQYYQYELLEGSDIQKLNGITGFDNSLGFDENGDTPTCIVLCAKKGDEIIAIAGASEEGEQVWEMGIDVKPAYRKNGLATILISRLTAEILEKGIVPLYCASTTNIGSQAIAHRSGLIPCCVSTYRTILDGSSVYDDILGQLKLSN